jgi:gamma-glutamyltranspeptidase/glutathione hydrolase
LNTPQYIHLVAENEKRVFADRAQYLGDPDFDPVPVAQLIDDGYLAKRAAEIDPSTPSAIEKVRPGIGMAVRLPVPGAAAEKTGEKAETTHFSVVDQWGNAVAFTYTINGYFGSGVVVAGAGFLLNDEMDDFSVKVGVENRFGLSTGDANSIAPAKRPLSSMAPTLLSRDGKLALVIGTPGGTRIFTSIFQVLNNVYEFRLPLKEAVAQMRFHHQLFPPNTLFWEPYNPIDGDLAKQLESRGYGLKVQGFNGDIQAVKIDGKVPEPVSDPRGRGVARVVRSQ